VFTQGFDCIHCGIETFAPAFFFLFALAFDCIHCGIETYRSFIVMKEQAGLIVSIVELKQAISSIA
jgi:transcription elongation factor Elf1